MATLPSLFSGFPAVMNSSGLLFLGLPSGSGLGCPILGDSSRGAPCTHTSPVHFLFGGTIAAVTNDDKVRGLKRQDWIPSWPGGQKHEGKVWTGLPPSGGSEGVPSRLPPGSGEDQHPLLVASSLPSLPDLTSPSPLSSLRTLVTELRVPLNPGGCMSLHICPNPRNVQHQVGPE